MSELFTVAQVAEYLQVHVNSIRDKAKRGEIPHIKESGLGYRFPKSEIDKWLKEITCKPSPIAKHLPDKKQKLDISVAEYLQGNLKGDITLSNKRGWWNFGRKGVFKRRLTKGYSWCYWYYDENGKRKRVTIPEATCLEDAIIEMEARVKKVFNKKHGIKNQSITFKEFAPIYLEKYAKPIKDSYDTDKKFIEGRLVPYFGDMLLTEITPEHVSDFIANFKPKVDYLEEVKGTTINKHLQVLSGMYNLAEEFGYEVGKNPVRRKIHFADESEYRRTKILHPTEEEPDLMREAATHLKPMIQCALLQFMRLEEILGLLIDDLDFEQGTITIRPENNKTGKLDIIPLRVEMKSILMTLLEENGGRSPYVFNYYDPRYGGKYRPVKSVQHAFQAACRRAGIEGLQFRDLRRTGATRLHEAGVDPLIVQRLLRHSSFKISEEVYIQSNLKMMKEALNKADEKATKKIVKPSVLAHYWHTKEAENKETSTISLFSMN